LTGFSHQILKTAAQQLTHSKLKRFIKTATMLIND